MDKSQLREQADKIRASGALGKSQTYRRLFDYLVDRTLADMPPKEVEIAIDVFGRDGNFDANQDSLVRVYVYNLRNKIAAFYDADGANEPDQLEIPKGTYGIRLARDEADPTIAAPRWRKLSPAILLGLLLAIALLALTVTLQRVPQPDSRLALATSPVWSGFDTLPADMPVQLVLGDLLMVSELNEQFEVAREIRDFAINTPADFELYIGQHEDLASRYRIADAHYLPMGVATALEPVLGTLNALGAEYRIVPASRLDSTGLPDAPVIYVGYFSALQQLREPLFAESRYRLHPSSVVLVDRQSGDVYAGEGERERTFTERYADFGLLIRRRSANGWPQLFLMSTRNAGLSELAREATDPGRAGALAPESAGRAFETLVEVSGNSDGELALQVHAVQPIEVVTPAPL